MASIRQIPGGHYQVQIRRFGRAMTKVFPSRLEAAEFGRVIEEEWRRQHAEGTLLYQRFGAFGSAWQLARLQLLGRGAPTEPSDREIAAELAGDPGLRFIGRVHETAQTADTLLAYKASLERDMAAAGARRRAGEIDPEPRT